MTSETIPMLPGKLGNPDLLRTNDPRLDPRVMEYFKVRPVGTQVFPLTAETPIEEILDSLRLIDAETRGFLGDAVEGLEPVVGVDRSVETVIGVDGNEIKVFVHRPSHPDRPVPGVLHLHGGGMVMLSAEGPLYERWRDEMAMAGMVAVGVEFRNGAGVLGDHPFPAGLDDCTSALKWMAEHKDRLGISRLIISGDSGGGNLSLATTLRAKRDGHLGLIDGVYALCPYISGVYADPPPELMSLFENDGLPIERAFMGALAKAYDPRGENATNPLAWPYHAEVSDLEGLPPHVISVNEVDPLRDEGIAYYRKLARAGVDARCRVLVGTPHAAENNHFKVIPEIARETIRHMESFASSL